MVSYPKAKKEVKHATLLKRAQEVFNEFIRKRDANKPCISCPGKVQQAGHYYAAGHYSNTRFCEDNTNGQCVRCNHFLHSNAIEYRKGLLKKIGEQRLLMLDARSRFKKKYDRFELELIIQTYKQKIKEIT